MSLPPPTSSALDEETARAEVYGLLSALYYAAPTAELMAQLRVAVTEAPAAGGRCLGHGHAQVGQQVRRWRRLVQLRQQPINLGAGDFLVEPFVGQMQLAHGFHPCRLRPSATSSMLTSLSAE